MTIVAGMDRLPKWVVVAEDDEDLRAAVTDMLVDEGYEVVTAATVREALLVSQELRPCAVVTGFRLLDGTGVELARQLLAKGWCRHVVVVSGTRKHAGLTPAGATFVVKPFEAEVLLSAVQQHC